MTHQTKSYKKFVATAATATLVASALAPVASAATPNFTDVSKDYKEAVDYIVKADIAQGTTETTFGTSQNISRGDAAVMIANALGLDTENAKDAGFQDVNNRVAGAVNAIVEAGIASGRTSSKFDPAAYITRQEMAKMLANAYELTATEDSGFTDVNNNWEEYVGALKEAGITLGKNETTFAPTANLTRGEFALFMFRAETMEEVAPEELAITAASAINANDIKVTLSDKPATDLTAGDFTVSVNGKDATKSVTKTTDKEYKLQLDVPLNDGDVVIVKGANELNGTVTFTYQTPAITSVEAIDGLVFTDKDGQELGVKINGVQTSVSDLAKRGYTVTFQADKNVFATGATSSTGLLDKGDLNSLFTSNDKSFKYKVSIQKDNEILTSNEATVRISQEDLTATSAIKSHNISVTAAGGAITSLTSNKLVQGETAQINELIADLQDGRKNVDLTQLTGANVEYESSDVTIANVNSTGQITTGQRNGKVTITVTSGTQKRDIQLEVVSEARELTTATYTGSALKLTNGANKNLIYTAKDQYGDSFVGTPTIVAANPVANGKTIATANTAGVSITDGRFSLPVTATSEVGSGTLQLKVGSKTIATTPISVAKETGQVKQTLVKSANQIDLNPATASKSITFNLENLYNGYFKENAQFTGLTVEVYDATKPNTPIYTGATLTGENLTVNAADLLLEVGGLNDLGTNRNSSVTALDVLRNAEVGTALVVVKDAAGKVIDQENFNVVDTSANATAATFNSAVEFTTGNATNTLTLDDIVTNVATTASSHDGVLRYEVVGGNTLVYYSATADVVSYSYANRDILVGVIEATSVAPASSITLSQTPSKFFAEEVKVDHSSLTVDQKVQFNFYKRGDTSVGKTVYTKK